MIDTDHSWVRHVIWWRVYPLGFVGAFPWPTAGAIGPEQHRLLRLIPWLDHVTELGASGIALGPIFASATHGYDTLDHYRLDPRLGVDRDFDELVAQAHSRGLHVQLDGVFNHVGRGHPAVPTSPEIRPASSTRGWVRHNSGPGDSRLATFEGHETLIALDHSNPEVQEHVVNVMRHWLNRGVSAWRLDAAYAVPIAFWSVVLPLVRATHPNVWFEAEVIHGDYADFVEASTVDTVTQYELWKAVWSSINDRNFFELDWALARHNRLIAGFAPSTFVGNHDVTRIATRILDSRHLPHAVALLATLGGTPTIYAGDEYGLRGVKEERAGGDDAIRPEWVSLGHGALTDTDEAIFRLHQRLIGLRRRHPWLHDATTTTLALRNDQYMIRISNGPEELDLALNLADMRMPMQESTVIIDADSTTRALASNQIAAHGWAVLARPREQISLAVRA